MTATEVLSLMNYGLVLIYGLLLSVLISGGWENRRQLRLVIALCPVFLLIQIPCWLVFGVTAAKRIYPLMVHLPLALLLTAALKRRWSIALVSVCTAYLCCQLPRWIGLVVGAISHSSLAGEISYTLCIVPIFLLLNRFFVRPVHAAMTASTQSLVLFGSLPVAYYVFDYATVVYWNLFHINGQILLEYLPTVLVFFYVLFLSAYHRQLQNRADAELQSSMLTAELKQSETELEALRSVESQVAMYQHDMRHHLNAIDAYLTANKPENAHAYIRRIRSDLEAVTPMRFCENELVNLLCASFSGKAAQCGAVLKVQVSLPKTLSLSDTELCSILSNGLENALHAVSQLPQEQRIISLYCSIRQKKLLIEVTNPYAGTVVMQDGVPKSMQFGHGYGCRSIQTIAQRHQGICAFDAENGVFTLRIVLP